jgi:hypothetical protein
LLLLELLLDELELDVVGRVRDFVEEERLTLERERVELELDVELLYFEPELLRVPDENDRFEEGVERL